MLICIEMSLPLLNFFEVNLLCFLKFL
uniref:Uncharacterized protein n=1 Tax=Anguilla anguilla TaxID=7936 RepID=A0A0E9XY21_ANGAN